MPIMKTGADVGAPPPSACFSLEDFGGEAGGDIVEERQDRGFVIGDQGAFARIAAEQIG
jgi:hypothetical protein